MEKATENRYSRAKLNIIVSLMGQVVTLFCGLIVPNLMITAFGSEAYGATSSIAQFLSYITLLEGGIGGVARAALYKPLAENNFQRIGLILNELKRFFRIVAAVFAGYVLVLAVVFQRISDIQVLDWWSTFFLVIVISLSTFAQYFIGIKYAVLLQADQRAYITSMIATIATVLNTCLVVLLVKAGSNLIMVKLVSSCVFILRPIAMWLYVKKKYALVKCEERDRNVLSQKWTGLGQHIAYFLHSNTDVAILTLFSDLTSVAIYSVYHMVVGQIQKLTESFSAGMEAFFGNLLAKEEYEQLHKAFGYYESLISMVSVVLFSCTAVLIVPFIKLYTAGVKDADYFAPLFAMLLIVSSFIYCLRMPYHAITIAAGHFAQTKMAAYGEAIINIILSVVLVSQYGLIGVAIGTLVATAFRFIYYVVYLSKNIFHRNIFLFLKRESVNFGGFFAICSIGNLLLRSFEIDNYADWVVCGIFVVLLAGIIMTVLSLIFYRKDTLAALHKVLKR